MEEFLSSREMTDFTDYDAFYDLFYDEDLRFEFLLNFREFSRRLDAVFPHKEALNFLPDFKRYSEVNVQAERHQGNNRVSMKGVSDKLRKLADEHLDSKGISQSIEPIRILDDNFVQQVNRRPRTKTQAAEIEHAVRHFIDVNLDEDPELYASFAQALEKILTEFKNNWGVIRKKLEELRQAIIKARNEPAYGLHRRKQMPIFRIFKNELFPKQELSEDQIGTLVSLTQSISELLETELRLRGFWDRVPARNRLKASLQEIMLSKEYYPRLPNIAKRYGEIVSRLMEWAESNNDTILYSE
jgi:type I restriction enzyme R subunit